MPALFLGVVVLMLFAAYFFSKADPKQVVRVLRYIGGGAALLFAVFLLIRGEIGPAVSIALLGLGLIGYVSLWPANFGGRGQKSPGRTSHARTTFLEMELDHGSNSIRGQVLHGPHQGVALDDLDVATLITLLGEMDEDSRRLLVAYLDRRQPHWRDNPVILPPGCARLATSLAATVSDTSMKTIGMVLVARCAARAAGGVTATMTSTLRPTSSAALPL